MRTFCATLYKASDPAPSPSATTRLLPSIPLVVSDASVRSRNCSMSVVMQSTRYGYTNSLLCSFISSNTFFLQSPVQGLLFCALKLLPVYALLALLPDCSLPAACPLVSSTLCPPSLPACMCSLGSHSITLTVLRRPGWRRPW